MPFYKKKFEIRQTWEKGRKRMRELDGDRQVLRVQKVRRGRVRGKDEMREKGRGTG